MTDSLPKIAVVLVAFAALGPYLKGSLRLDHFVIYGFIPFFTVYFLQYRRSSQVSFLAVLTYALMTLITVTALISTLVSGFPISISRTFSQLDNLLAPLILLTAFTLVSGTLNLNKVRELTATAAKAIIAALTINSLLIFFQMLTGQDWFFQAFLPPADAQANAQAANVWERSLSMGRYLGVFNQPFESGMSYSIALICWVYLQQNKRRISLWSYLVLGCLLAGGVLSVSKSFILVGVPIGMVLFFLRSASAMQILNWRFFTFLGMFVTGITVISSKWNGLDFFLRLFNPSGNDNLVVLYTANRFGATTDVTQGFSRIMSDSPLLGLGFQSIEVVDSGFLDVFAQGGFIALMLCIIMFVLITIYSMDNLFRSKEARFVFALILVTFVNHFGANALTANRESLQLWLFLSLLLSAMHLKLTPKARKDGSPVFALPKA